MAGGQLNWKVMVATWLCNPRLFPMLGWGMGFSLAIPTDNRLKWTPWLVGSRNDEKKIRTPS